MKELLERCCGLDVHKDTVVATIMIGAGKELQKETKTFSTMTDELIHLDEWLKSHNITYVAMESTGVYWKPIFNILGNHFDLLLVNARHVKNVPGRKTDVSDSAWLCKLLKNGLLERNFIPPEKIRNLRDLSRYRKKIVHMITAEKNRLLKVLETANIKLGSILSDVFGVTGMKIIKDISCGIKDPRKLALHKAVNTRSDLKEFERALTGTITPHHVFLLKTSLDLIANFEQIIATIEKQEDQIIVDYEKEIDLIITVPGVQKTSAISILSEIGSDMSVFPTASHLSSWAGVCPGNNESAGKKKSTRTNPGNSILKTSLVECAWAASRTKNTYLGEKYRKLVPRLGKKKALLAIGHKILNSIYNILLKYEPYKELGKEYLINLGKHKKLKYHQKQLENVMILLLWKKHKR